MAKRKKFKKPFAPLYYPALWLCALYYRFRYGVTIDRRALKGLRGAALILVPHTSTKDHLLLGMALRPRRPTFVLSEHFMTRPKLRPTLKLMHVITKKMFCPDVSTVRNILRAKASGNLIVLFPEGRLSCYGRTLPVAEGTAALVKRLQLPVYTVTANGAYLTFPKWAKKSRRGKIHVVAAALFSPQDLSALSVEEIEARLAVAMAHDDEQAMDGVAYRCRDMTLGLDGILYRCPRCQAEFTLSTRDGHITCPCGLDATLNEYYRLEGAPFERINDWFLWQQNRIRLTERLESPVRVGAVDERGNMDFAAGEGRVTLDGERFTFEGTVFGEPLSFVRATATLGAFPITVAQEFDVYYGGKLYYFYPRPDRRQVVKWVSYLDRVNQERKPVPQPPQP
ncbi:MAG: lysophospholipid acyltransferase family protein [Eubacteriales bacterium]